MIYDVFSDKKLKYGNSVFRHQFLRFYEEGNSIVKFYKKTSNESVNKDDL